MATQPTKPSEGTQALPRLPGMAATDELIRSNLLRPEHRKPAAEIIARLSQPTAYPFEADASFLNHCMAHHVAVYFRQVMEPEALSHRAGKVHGKLIRDEEVEKATTAIVQLIAGEIGPGYSQHMYKYFGDLEGMASFLYSRVRALLIEEALKYNETFLKRINQGSAARAILANNQEAGPTATF